MNIRFLKISVLLIFVVIIEARLTAMHKQVVLKKAAATSSDRQCEEEFKRSVDSMVTLIAFIRNNPTYFDRNTQKLHELYEAIGALFSNEDVCNNDIYLQVIQLLIIHGIKIQEASIEGTCIREWITMKANSLMEGTKDEKESNFLGGTATLFAYHL